MDNPHVFWVSVSVAPFHTDFYDISPQLIGVYSLWVTSAHSQLPEVDKLRLMGLLPITGYRPCNITILAKYEVCGPFF